MGLILEFGGLRVRSPRQWGCFKDKRSIDACRYLIFSHPCAFLLPFLSYCQNIVSKFACYVVAFCVCVCVFCVFFLLMSDLSLNVIHIGEGGVHIALPTWLSHYYKHYAFNLIGQKMWVIIPILVSACICSTYAKIN